VEAKAVFYWFIVMFLKRASVFLVVGFMKYYALSMFLIAA